jgi:hypothetical protein
MKKKDEQSRLSVRVTTWLTPEDADLLKRRAVRLNMTESAMVRWLIRRFKG